MITTPDDLAFIREAAARAGPDVNRFLGALQEFQAARPAPAAEPAGPSIADRLAGTPSRTAGPVAAVYASAIDARAQRVAAHQRAAAAAEADTEAVLTADGLGAAIAEGQSGSGAMAVDGSYVVRPADATVLARILSVRSGWTDPQSERGRSWNVSPRDAGFGREAEAARIGRAEAARTPNGIDYFTPALNQIPVGDPAKRDRLRQVAALAFIRERWQQSRRDAVAAADFRQLLRQAQQMGMPAADLAELGATVEHDVVVVRAQREDAQRTARVRVAPLMEAATLEARTQGRVLTRVYDDDLATAGYDPEQFRRGLRTEQAFYDATENFDRTADDDATSWATIARRFEPGSPLWRADPQRAARLHNYARERQDRANALGMRAFQTGQRSELGAIIRERQQRAIEDMRGGSRLKDPAPAPAEGTTP